MTGRKRPSRDPDSVGARLGSKAAVKAGRRSAPRREEGRHRRRAKAGHKKKTAKPPRGSVTAFLGRFARSPSKRKGEGTVRERRCVFGERSRILKRLNRFEQLPSSTRVWVVTAAFALFGLMIFARAVQLQLVDGERYWHRAIGQGTKNTTISGRRGRILDRRGDELANTVDSESIFADRRAVKHPAAAARRIAPILGLDRASLKAKLSRKGPAFVYLRRKAPPAVAQAVRAAKVPGIGVKLEPKRVYGNVRLAAHVLGFVDVEGIGRSGIERTMQDELQGHTSRVPTIADALRRAVWSDGVGSRGPYEGHDVVLTIDRHVQFVAEEVLEKTVEKHKARSGVVVVLDVKTSEVLALASHPTFNPNNLSGSSVADRKNQVISTIFDPGSTAKIVTIAAALDTNTVRPTTLVDCEEGNWRVGNRTIRDANHRFGNLTVAEVMKKSSNIGAGKIGLRVGAKALHGYFSSFGIGTRTGIELPGEVRGILRPYAKWRQVDLVNVAFGQGVSVTALQVAQAANVIAAGGVLRRPTLVREVRRPAGLVVPAHRTDVRRVVSERTAQLITEMMAEVTSEDGTAPKAAVPGFSVAGKTGTAQKYDVRLGAYSRKRYVASFVGFVPAERPEVTVLVVIDEPRGGSIYGGPVAGPAFREITLAALASKELYPKPAEAPPSARGSSGSTVREDPNRDLEGNPDDAVLRAAEEVDLKVQASAHLSDLDGALSSSARALLQEGLPRKEVRTPDPSKLRLMPDLRGLDAAAAVTRCVALALDPEVLGKGRVHAQRPRPGASVSSGARCTLELRRDG